MQTTGRGIETASEQMPECRCHSGLQQTGA